MIALTNPGWMPAVLAAGGLALALLWRAYRHTPPGVTRWLAPAVKLTGFLLLGLILLEPAWVTTRAKPGANLLAVLVDTGRGLRLRDRGQTRTRARQLQDTLVTGDQPAAWLARLSETFPLRRYQFDVRLARREDFAALPFDGQASHLGGALRALGEHYRGTPLAGIVVLSDGNATDLSSAATLPADLPPVYPVVLGSRTPAADLAVSSVSSSESAFEDAPVTILATIDAVGFAGKTVATTLLDARGAVVASELLAVTGDDERLSARFRLRPTQPGSAFYRVRVVPPVGNRVEEATTANNSRLLHVDRRRGPYRVLYVGGRPNWELKFLRRALAEERDIELVALVRMAPREPKFVFRGRDGESGNPLFRGFARDDEAERYDQPVVVRLGTRDGSELREGFPRTAAELFAFHAVVLDDVEASFFTAAQHDLLVRFVADRGGGLLALGGVNALRAGGWQESPLRRVLPTHLESPPPEPGPSGPLRFTLTREGWLTPWLRLRQTEADEQARLDAMPLFRTLSRVGSTKPGASVLAEVNDGGDGADHRFPAIIQQRAGLGRVVVAALGDLWRWQLRTPEHGADLARFWRQLTRHLVADAPARVAIEIHPDDRDAGARRLQIAVRDAEFRPADNAQVTVELTDPSGATTRLPTEPSPDEPGTWVARTASIGAGAPATGGYRVQAHATATGTERPRARDDAAPAESGFVHDPEAEEHQSIRANPALLAAIARRTGGRMVPLAELDAFAAELPGRKAPVTETLSEPLWNRGAVFALALACFLLEWSLRRARGLA